MQMLVSIYTNIKYFVYFTSVGNPYLHTNDEELEQKYFHVIIFLLQEALMLKLINIYIYVN